MTSHVSQCPGRKGKATAVLAMDDRGRGRRLKIIKGKKWPGLLTNVPTHGEIPRLKRPFSKSSTDSDPPKWMHTYIVSACKCHGPSQQIACFVKTKPANGGATIHDVHRFSAFQRAKPLSKISRSPVFDTPNHSVQ